VTDDGWRAALEVIFSDLVRFLIPRVDDAAAVETALFEHLAHDASLARGVARAILALPAASRERVLPIAVRDPRPGVRAALFDEWAPRRGDGRDQIVALLPEPAWSALLDEAVRDDDPDVRRAAAALRAWSSAATSGPVEPERFDAT
jgi:hypothetical protein